MLMGVVAMSPNGASTVLFSLVAYLFGNMGAFLVVQAVGTSEGSDRMDAYRGLALLGAALTVVALYYYLVLASRMYIDAPGKTEPSSSRRRSSSPFWCARWGWSWWVCTPSPE